MESKRSCETVCCNANIFEMFCVASLHLNLINLVKFILPLRVEVLFMLLKRFSISALKRRKQKEEKKNEQQQRKHENNIYTV